MSLTTSKAAHISAGGGNDKIKGKVVLVTGANRGIGKAIVDGFVQHGALKVYAAVRTLQTADPLVQEHGADRVVPIRMDLSKPETIQESANLLAQDVDIVINNAGVLTNNSNPLDKVAIENLEYEMKINVYGLLHVAQAFAPTLIERKGIFCQLNSIGSLRCAAPHVSTYSASKAAAYSLTQSLRMSLKDRGVTVLSVHPGPIATDMIQTAGLAKEAEPASQVAEAIVNAIQTGDDGFHVYPDTKSQALGRVYEGFAKAVIEPCVPYPK